MKPVDLDSLRLSVMWRLVGSQAGLLGQLLLCLPRPLFRDLLRTVTATVPI